MNKINKIIEELTGDNIYGENLLVNGILEMGRIAFVPPENRGSEYDMYIHTNDPGKYPHFHVRQVGRDNIHFKWDKCIRLDVPEYFSHGKGYRGVIPDKKIEREVIKILSKKHPKYNVTYWEYAVQLWNENNSDVQLPDDLQMPDYSKLR